MGKQVEVREGARRQHRAVSFYAVIHCWQKGLDGLALRRKTMKRLLGLKNFKETRLKWLRQDLRELFPYSKVYRSSKKYSFSSIVISRVHMKFPAGKIKTSELVKSLVKNGHNVGILDIWKRPTKRQLKNIFEGAKSFFADSVNTDERLLSSYLSLIVQGQISPGCLLPPKDS